MTIVVGDIGIVANEVPTIAVVDKSIAVVVNSIASNLVRVNPDVVIEVAMADVDSGINHGNNNAVTAVPSLPSFGGVHRIQIPVEIAPIKVSLGKFRDRR